MDLKILLAAVVAGGGGGPVPDPVRDPVRDGGGRKLLLLCGMATGEAAAAWISL